MKAIAATHSKRSLLKRALLGLTLMIVAAFGSAWLLDASIDKNEDGAGSASHSRATIAGVKKWGYQLQGLQVDRVAAGDHDLIVVDETLDRENADGTGAALARLRQKPDGGRRLVVAYLSIGEAEDYRPYWKAAWVAPGPRVQNPIRFVGLRSAATSPARTHARFAAKPDAAPLLPTAAAPAWLGSENAEWRGNYNVRFWHPDWKALVLGGPGAALDRIIEAGFDGVYLDRADVYNLWRHEQPSAKADMVEFVAEIAAYARRKKPGFLVVLQNAEELLANSTVRRALDAVAKEDLLYGLEQEGRENASAEVQSSLRYLRQARREGIPVLVVEYLGDVAAIDLARRRIESEGFLAYFGPRSLDVLSRSN
ncbi:MAG: endo alpha-1,4 polygalactosaminidase [Hyphomicrobiaceae bacterium]